MPTCQNCNQQWSWKATIRTMFTIRMKLKCAYCGETQYLSAKSRKRSVSMSIPISFFLVLLMSFQVPVPFQITYIVVAFLVIFLVLPIFYEVSSEEEALW